jgi:hypothetical protein
VCVRVYVYGRESHRQWRFGQSWRAPSGRNARGLDLSALGVLPCVHMYKGRGRTRVRREAADLRRSWHRYPRARTLLFFPARTFFLRLDVPSHCLSLSLSLSLSLKKNNPINRGASYRDFSSGTHLLLREGL